MLFRSNLNLDHRIDVVRTRKIINFQRFDLNPTKFADRDYIVCESMPIALSQHDITIAWRGPNGLSCVEEVFRSTASLSRVLVKSLPATTRIIVNISMRTEDVSVRGGGK